VLQGEGEGELMGEGEGEGELMGEGGGELMEGEGEVR
jgi:hypothetical protein